MFKTQRYSVETKPVVVHLGVLDVHIIHESLTDYQRLQVLGDETLSRKEFGVHWRRKDLLCKKVR